MSVLSPLGALYIPKWNNIAWSQPGGVGTKVFPQENSGSFGYPVPGIRMEEAGQALWISGCSHGFDCLQVFRDYDSNTQKSVAVLTCPVCTFILNYVEPYEAIEDVLQYPILIP